MTSHPLLGRRGLAGPTLERVVSDALAAPDGQHGTKESQLLAKVRRHPRHRSVSRATLHNRLRVRREFREEPGGHWKLDEDYRPA